MQTRELAVVGSPGQIEIVEAGEAGAIDDGTIERRTLKHGGKVRDSDVTPWKLDVVGHDRDAEQPRLFDRSRAGPQLRTILACDDRVDGQLFRLAMEGEMEAIGKQLAKHRHLLVIGGVRFARRDGLNLEAVIVHPSRPTRHGARMEIVGRHHERAQAVVPGEKLMRALHRDVAPPELGIFGFDGGDFEGLGPKRGRHGNQERGAHGEIMTKTAFSWPICEE